MKVYTTQKFIGRITCETAAIVVAINREQALQFLNYELMEKGFGTNLLDLVDIIEVPMVVGYTNILCDGG